MKSMIIFQVILTVLGSAIIWSVDASQSAVSYFFGSSLVLANLLIIFMVVKFIFEKKYVGLSIAIIVFKYAILGFIIYRLIKIPWIQPLWLGLGVGTLMLSALLQTIPLGPKAQAKG